MASDDVLALNPGYAQLLAGKSGKNLRLPGAPSGKSEDKKGLFSSAWHLLAPKSAPAYVEEYRFNRPFTKHRSEFAWPMPGGAGGLLVEVDGGQHLVIESEDGKTSVGGRHNTDADRHKLNLAAERGFLVLRYTPEMLARDPAGCVEQVLRVLARLRLWSPPQ